MSVQHHMEIFDVSYIIVWIFPSNSAFHIYFNFFLIGGLWVWTGFVHTTSSYNTTDREGEDNYFDIFFLGNQTVLF